MHTVFSHVEEVWEAQLQDIERAKKSILLEQYIIEDLAEDKIGWRFLDALIRKQREGVEVRCILDTQGSYQVFLHGEFNRQFTESGVTVFYYKTLGYSNIIRPLRFVLRDHRKLLLVDDEISWIGGVVIGERFRDWDDLMVRYTDPSVANVLNKEFRAQLLRLQEKTSLLAPLVTIDKHNHVSGNAPGVGNRFCYEEICHAIMRAGKSVTLVTPYFAPPIKLQRIIHRRLRAGLKITLLTPRVTDVKLINLARESYMKKMLDLGLTLYYCEKMVHAKAVIVDDLWMTYGSTNLDAVSLIFNHELNMVTRDQQLIQEVQRKVSHWIGSSRPVTFGDCEYQKQTFFGKLVGKCLRYIA